MKKTYIAGVAALSLATAIGGIAVAQQAAPRAHHMRSDADGDGRVTQAEFVQQRVGRLSALDADRDGSVTAEEMRAGMQARRAERASMRFDRLDADKDGAISRAEFDAPRANRPDGPRAGHRMGKGPRAHRMGRRMEARGPMVIAEAQTKATEAFARMDANRDGVLTVEERRASMMQRREQRQERRAARRAAQTPASPAAPASE